MKRLFDPEKFSGSIVKAVARAGITYKIAAKQIGVSAPTLNRVVHHRKPPNVEGYLRISAWLAKQTT